MNDTARQEADTFWIRIFVGGDFEQAKQVCREECIARGLCVTVERTAYIYTGGEEAGVVVGLINYPRFPDEPASILERATSLGHALMNRLCQRSFSLMTPEKTIRYFRETKR